MQTIIVSDMDHHKLTHLLESLSPQRREELEGLENELFRADIIPVAEMPADIVTMGSTVVYEDMDSGRIVVVQITYPEEADIESGKISILAPVGAALLGLRVGQSISWPLPHARIGRLRVKQIKPSAGAEASPRKSA